MRNFKFVVIGLMFFAVSSFAQREFFVVPNVDNLGIYANQTRQMNERAIETVGKSSVLRVVESKGNHYRVRTNSGTVGWIEKRLATRSDSKRAYSFDDVEIQGYLDNPTPIYITDVDDGSFAAIELDRSFADAIKRNADKERASREIR